MQKATLARAFADIGNFFFFSEKIRMLLALPWKFDLDSLDVLKHLKVDLTFQDLHQLGIRNKAVMNLSEQDQSLIELMLSTDSEKLKKTAYQSLSEQAKMLLKREVAPVQNIPVEALVSIILNLQPEQIVNLYATNTTYKTLLDNPENLKILLEEYRRLISEEPYTGKEKQKAKDPQTFVQFMTWLKQTLYSANDCTKHHRSKPCLLNAVKRNDIKQFAKIFSSLTESGNFSEEKLLKVQDEIMLRGRYEMLDYFVGPNNNNWEERFGTYEITVSPYLNNIYKFIVENKDEELLLHVLDYASKPRFSKVDWFFLSMLMAKVIKTEWAKGVDLVTEAILSLDDPNQVFQTGWFMNAIAQDQTELSLVAAKKIIKPYGRFNLEMIAAMLKLNMFDEIEKMAQEEELVNKDIDLIVEMYEAYFSNTPGSSSAEEVRDYLQEIIA